MQNISSSLVGTTRPVRADTTATSLEDVAGGSSAEALPLLARLLRTARDQNSAAAKEVADE